MSIVSFLIIIPLFAFAISIHEFAHGWVALKLGDPTAKYSGRLTLNPLKHIDPVLTIILPILFFITTGFAVGGAKPVPINFSRLRKPKQDIIWVGLAGPMANIATALIIGTIFRLGLPMNTVLFSLLLALGQINLVLAIFNLIPLPPLDGSRILLGLLPYDLARSYAKLERFGILILLALFAFRPLRLIFWSTFFSAFSMLAKIIGIPIL